jgi:hypothetical protein
VEGTTAMNLKQVLLMIFSATIVIALADLIWLAMNL